ncbi:LysM peptidoglycan-binding domain-containing protein [Cronobacter malonaticus]
MSKFISATYSENNKTAEYVADDGSRLLRIKGSMAWRFQNPGAMESTPFTRGLPGWIGEGVIHNPKAHLFAIFDSYENGREGNRKLLQYRYKDSNMLDVMKAYAVSGDGKNNPEEYAAFIVSETGITDKTRVGEMSDAVLNKVLGAIQKKEGYIPGKEKNVNTTNISVTDGVRPVPDYPFKVTLGTCEYDWKTNEYGELPTIAHMSDGMAIEVKATNSRGELETLYSAKAGNQSKNILLKRKFVQYKANTLAQNPKVPREKSQPKPIEYIVQSGDVLSKIAARFDVSVSELVASNGIKDANKIYPGQKIVIYGKKETSPDERQSHSVNLSGQYPPVQLGNTYPLPPYPESIESKDAPGISDSNSSRRASSPQSTRQHSESFPLPPYPDVIDTQGRTGTPSSASSMSAVSATKPKENKEKLETVGGKNSGNGQAHLPVLQGEAPWMLYALQEANNYGGVDESMFPSKHNYHSLSKKNSHYSMSSTLWCESFVNYCLQEAKYPKSHNTTGSTSFVNDINFKKIKTPIYGCLAVWWSTQKQQGHVAFVFGRDNKTNEIIVLGGNQDDSLNFMLKSDTSKPLVGYYLPATYSPSKQADLNMYDVVELNSNINYKYVRKLNGNVKDRWYEKKIMFFICFLLFWAITAKAGERGYYLFVWGNESGKAYVKKYRAEDKIYASNEFCWKQRAGNSIAAVYINIYPQGMTDLLIKSFLSGSVSAITNIRMSLRNFSDDQVSPSHGFDGMIIVNKKTIILK